jgi:hypothetical protein
MNNKKTETKWRETNWQLVTPEIASKWLERNTNNRAMRQHQVRRLVEALKSGRYIVNGDPIRFDVNGVLLDGQHRLSAIVQSGVSVECLVITNLPVAAFNTIDTGTRRNGADVLLKEKYQHILASAVGMLNELRAGRFALHTQSDNDQIVAGLEAHPGIRESVAVCLPLKRMTSVSLMAALHYEFRKINETVADDFIEDLILGSELRSNDPVFLLREKLVRNHGAVAKLPRKHIAALTIKAFNCRLGGDTPLRLVFRENDDFPKIKSRR